ncbi:MAG: DUF4349 domain-containing protein [Spirochaetales bacterium]|nr:DUF4349 domain-containing protein [Spirochaetales bacterium]MCF7938935.1 DUF4349 domain-containing protein [Spirochaetales bacterium]
MTLYRRLWVWPLIAAGLFLFFLLFTLSGCGVSLMEGLSSAGGSGGGEASAAYEKEEYMASEPQAKASMSKSGGAGAPAPDAGRSAAPEASRDRAEGLSAPAPEAAADNGAGAGQESGGPAAVPERPEKRKRIYTGSCGLRVAEPEQTRRKIESITEEVDGYVESSYSEGITLRVPAASFFSVFERILALGEIVDRSIETFDVTEAYSDLSSRREIAVRTRTRLYRLLETTEDVQERLKILREIRRLTERIEHIDMTLKIMDSRIAYSRISVRLEQRIDTGASTKAEIPFGWIAGLDPFARSITGFLGPEPDPGDEFAVFEKLDAYQAETADGVRLRGATTENHPRGDALFWQEALEYHLGPFFAGGQPLQAGELRGVLFRSKDLEPYYYLVFVLPAGEELHVYEVFYPDADTFEGHHEGVLDVFRRLEQAGGAETAGGGTAEAVSGRGARGSEDGAV